VSVADVELSVFAANEELDALIAELKMSGA
jgi:hypothetical protein